MAHRLLICLPYAAEYVEEMGTAHAYLASHTQFCEVSSILGAGTGKTLLARAVANRTDACFIRVIGSELVQKYVGEGARMVRELFQMARSKKACLIFFDEVPFPSPPSFPSLLFFHGTPLRLPVLPDETIYST